MDTHTQVSVLAAEVAPRYGSRASALTFLGGFLNQVYEFEREGQSYILRISAESQRTASMVYAEIDWLRYLESHGLSVARAVPSLAGNWVEVVHAKGKSVPVIAFEKAPGHPPGDDDWGESLFRTMGRFMGKMHRLTKDYTPDAAGHRRPEWWQDLDIFAATYLPAVDEAIQAKWREIRSYAECLPRDRDAYGLIHVDFHRGNFFVHNGELTLFDFDDCVYSWFAEDLAMALFYSNWLPAAARKNARGEPAFFRAFLAGYCEENELAERWLLEIPHFLKQREICLYIVLTALGKGQWHETVKEFMQGRRERLLNDVPYMEMTFLDLRN